MSAQPARTDRAPSKAIREVLFILSAPISEQKGNSTGNKRQEGNTANDTRKISENHNPKLIRKRALDA
jgi:hypothetical protein